MKLTPYWIRLALLCLLLCATAASGAKAKSKPKASSKKKSAAKIEKVAEPEPGVRDITLRHTKPKKDKDALKRVRHFKARLPAEVRYRYNFAWARADIKGLRKKEYYAHSRIQDLDKWSYRAKRKIRNISLKPPKETAQFKTLYVDYKGNIGGPNAIPRHFDTEYKIMEDIAARLTNNTAMAGNILLYTDLEPCPSCRGVMRQFLTIYTNIEIEVLYDWP